MNIEAGRESGFFYVRPSYSSVILGQSENPVGMLC